MQKLFISDILNIKTAVDTTKTIRILAHIFELKIIKVFLIINRPEYTLNLFSWPNASQMLAKSNLSINSCN